MKNWFLNCFIYAEKSEFDAEPQIILALVWELNYRHVRVEEGIGTPQHEYIHIAIGEILNKQNVKTV